MATTGVMRESTGWTVTDSTFAARLALVRMRMGWNMKEAARECGLNAQTWRLWEIDGVTPRNHVQIANMIATRTGCDYLWLLLGPDRGGEGGLNARYRPLAKRVIPKRQHAKTQPKVRATRGSQRPTSTERSRQRRPRAVRSPNRPELVDA